MLGQHLAELGCLCQVVPILGGEGRSVLLILGDPKEVDCACHAVLPSLTSAGARGGGLRLLAAHLGGRVTDRGVDRGVLATAADVARQTLGDLVVGGLWVGSQQRIARHDEATCADAALEAAIFPEGTLDRM